MKILNQKQVENIVFKTKRPTNPFVTEVMNTLAKIEPYQTLFISKKEWPLKCPPTNGIIPRVKKACPNKTFLSRTRINDSGWCITRTR